MTLDEFVDGPYRNAWVIERGIEYYVRKNLRYRGAIDLANCSSPEDSREFGWWRFLKRYAHRYPFIMENVLNPQMAEYLRRRKWRERQDLAGCPTFYSPLFDELFSPAGASPSRTSPADHHSR